ncbi:MAG: sensory transduction histidine kinase, partial [Deltaproteobacteria bacterium]|nr:sensory transduction histidine kinase [Deltaproteobacteria bacterium]
MKIKTWIVSTVLATLAISVLIVLIVSSLLRDLDREAANSRIYREIRWKTHALGLLTARMQDEPGPSRIRQVREIRGSLEALLGTLAPSDARAESLVRQIRTDYRELGYSLEKLIAISLAPGGPMEAERYEVLFSQLSMKTQFIVDDTQRLVEISEARMASSRRNAILLAVALIVGLLSINAVLSIFTGGRIVRAQESLRQALSKAEEGDRLLSAFLEYVPEGIVMADAGLNVTGASRDSRERLGISESTRSMERIAAQTAAFHADGKTPMAFEELPLVRAVRGGEVVKDAEVIQADVRGERVPLLCSAGPIRDAAGRIIGGIVASRDITGRRQAEEALHRLSQFPEQNPNPVLRFALDGTLLYANTSARSWLAALGWRAGSPLPDAVRGAVSDAGGRDHAVETEVTDTEGRTIGLTAVRPPGEEYVNVYGVDLTARKRAALAQAASEKRYRELLDTANSIILRLDDRGVIRFINDFGLRFFGYDAGGLMGRDVTTIVPMVETGTGRDLHALVGDLLAHPEKHAEFSIENVRKDGKTVWVAWTNKAIPDGQGNVREILAIGNDITALKEAEAAVRASEEGVRRKLKTVLSPEGDLGVLALADLVDIPALRDLLDDFYAVARIPMSILDTEGRLLVGVGWQDICTRFHRADPVTSRNCLESDTILPAGLAQGESRLYKCKNNLWDMATPIFVAGRHVGNILTGQFFFEDDSVDRELFRAQARERGFDESEYLAALDRVPRMSRETVDRGMAFFRKLADMLSQHGYSNAHLA